MTELSVRRLLSACFSLFAKMNLNFLPDSDSMQRQGGGVTCLGRFLSQTANASWHLQPLLNTVDSSLKVYGPKFCRPQKEMSDERWNKLRSAAVPGILSLGLHFTRCGTRCGTKCEPFLILRRFEPTKNLENSLYAHKLRTVSLEAYESWLFIQRHIRQ